MPDKNEANIHVWVDGWQPHYTVFVESNKWKDTPEYRQFLRFGPYKIAVQLRFAPDLPVRPELKGLAELLGDVVQKAQEAPVDDGQKYPLVF